MTTARIWAIASGVAALALVAVVGQPASAAPESGASASAQALDIRECKPTAQALLPDGNPYLVQLNFAAMPDRVPSNGEVDVAVVFVDFPDAPARITAQSYFAQFVPQGLKVIQDVSYGAVSFSINGPHGWFRMPRPSGEYGYFRGMEGDVHRDFIADAVRVSDSVVDYSSTDAFIIVMPPDMTDPGYAVSPAFVADRNFGVPVDGNVLMNGTTIGTDWSDLRHLVVAHEILHTMGLVDLYKMDSTPPLNLDTGEYVGTYSLMSVYDTATPQLLAWERWVRGWIRDDQVSCLNRGTHSIALDSMLAPGQGDLMAVLPLGDTRFLALEGRVNARGLRVTKQGVIPYVVDPTVVTGRGPIRVPQAPPGQPMNPLQVGSAVAIEGVGVEVLSLRNNSFNVRIVNPAPPATAPGPPGGLRLKRTLTGSVLTWSEPLKTGWSTVTGYEVRWNGGPWQPISQRFAAIQRGQAAKPLTFEVRALNVAGPGPVASMRVPAR